MYVNRFCKRSIVPLEKMKILSQIIATDEVTHVINNAGHFVQNGVWSLGANFLSN